jgi:hypothetical protein
VSDAFDIHPLPWCTRYGQTIVDDLGALVAEDVVEYADANVADAIVAAVNAEPELRARIAELEAQLRRAAVILRDAALGDDWRDRQVDLDCAEDCAALAGERT